MKTKNSLKPIDYDIHLKYICQNCGNTHWLSYKEASTKNYKIVCDCDNIFTVKCVSGFKLKFRSKKIKQQKPVVEEKSNNIPDDLLTKTATTLVSYGFTMTEAKELVSKSYQQFPSDSVITLVKQVLESLRSENV